MTTPAYQIRLHDLRQLVGGLVDLRGVGALTDLRQLVGGLVEVGVPEAVVGSVLTVTARVPALSTTGTVPFVGGHAAPWKPLGATVLSGSLRLTRLAVELAERAARYVPGAAWPPGGTAGDRIRVTDSLGASAAVDVVTSVPTAMEVTVPVDADSIASVQPGGSVIMTPAGGVAPLFFDILQNETGGAITGIGADRSVTVYTAGPSFGVDRLRVTDALGAVGYITVEVKPITVLVWVDGSGLDQVWSAITVPYAQIEGAGGVAPYTVTLETNATGASIVQVDDPLRASFSLADNETEAPIDCTGWTGEAAIYSQRGVLLASGLAVTAAGELLEVALPDPATLPLPVAVLRVTAHPSSGMLAVTNPDLVLEMLISAEET